MKNVRAKKHLGQHFLNNEQIAFDITDLLSEETKNVVEIGPGMGVLTQFLVKKNFTTEVVEIDTESVLEQRIRIWNDSSEEQRRALVDSGIFGPNVTSIQIDNFT